MMLRLMLVVRWEAEVRLREEILRPETSKEGRWGR